MNTLEFTMSSSRPQPSTSGSKISSKRKNGAEKHNSGDNATTVSASEGTEDSDSNLDAKSNEDDNDNDLSDSKLIEEDEVEANGLSEEALKAYTAAQNRAGVIYISRIPPGMSPDKVRHLMSACGEIGKVFLQQEGAFRLAFPTVFLFHSSWLFYFFH
jgi:ESF2/ABP1 family protein